MRDPNRIPAFMAKLEFAWSRFPDLRLGQLIENLRSKVTNLTPTFYVEDDEMERALDMWLKEER